VRVSKGMQRSQVAAAAAVDRLRRQTPQPGG
jgi:hypothetical protein